MKIVLPILAIYFLFFGSCGANNAPITEQTIYQELNIKRVVEIEACEYFVTSTGHNDMYTHKGNCKNPIHYCDRIVQAEMKIQENKKVILKMEEQVKELKKREKLSKIK